MNIDKVLNTIIVVMLSCGFIGYLLSGCDSFSKEAVNKRMADSDKELISNIVYYKDSRTDLCFATLWIGGSGGLLSQVPCTPEVEKLLKK